MTFFCNKEVCAQIGLDEFSAYWARGAGEFLIVLRNKTSISIEVHISTNIAFWNLCESFFVYTLIIS